LTKTLCLCTNQPVVGLCHGLFDNLWFLRNTFGLESEEQITYTYGGINHFFWTTSISVGGQDGLRLLQERMQSKSLPELVAAVQPDRIDSYVADELFRFTGVLPYIADRHTSEFFSPYITSLENLSKYHLTRTTIQERKDAKREAEAEVERMSAEGIADRYTKRSRETAADIINAIVTSNAFIDVGNVPNIGQVANLPLGSVLETPVLVTRSGFRPIAVGYLPEPVRTWVERQIRVQDMTVEAAMRGDLEMALRALALDPLVSRLNLQKIRDMGMRLLAANAEYLPQFRGKLKSPVS